MRVRTKIEYLMVLDKLYRVTDIDFTEMTLEACECDLTAALVPEETVFLLDDFKDFRVILRNYQGIVINFAKYVKNRKVEC